MSNYAKIIVGIRTKGKDIMLKITVIDDEKEYIELIRQTVDNWLMEKGCQGEIDCFNHAEDFKAQIEAGRCYDIYFMDIEMPDINGMELAAYIRMKNIQLGYTLPKQWVSKAGMSSVRVYVSGDNLLTISDITGIFDPETLGGAWGDGKLYPLCKTISVGLNVNF